MSTAVLTRMSDVTQTRVEWLWPRRFPLGKISIIAGDPGLGKSVLSTYIAARVTTGDRFADGEEPVAGDVLFVCDEDDAADTIAPRLEAAMADMERVHYLDGVQQGNAVHPFSLGNPAALDDALHQIAEEGGNTKLVIIDPFDVYLSGRDGNSGGDIRELLRPVAAIAAKRHCAVVLVQHLNKGTNSAAIYRIKGSIQFVAASRAAWAVVRDRHEDGRLLFLPIKNNLCRHVDGLACSIVDQDGWPVIRWEPDPVATNATDAMRQESAEKRMSDTTKDILEAVEASEDPITPAEVAEIVGITPGAARIQMRRLEDKGLIERESYGHYRVCNCNSVTVTGVTRDTQLQELQFPGGWEDIEPANIDPSLLRCNERTGSLSLSDDV